ncbi:MAG: metal-dependent transcriptional regulator [Sedimentisphaerales bacterium]|nr:metal-dependent transcriptional regulator [Sedimentisphaerales bacterium]
MTVKKKLSASLEDYLEAIYNLSREPKVARSRDIAQSLGVSRASVTGALKLLRSKGLINYKPYSFITLTEKGTHQAQEVVRKHNIIESFFVNVLGVQRKAARHAACKAEHALGPEVISRLLNFTEFAEKSNLQGTGIANEFKEFCRYRKVNEE